MPYAAGESQGSAQPRLAQRPDDGRRPRSGRLPDRHLHGGGRKHHRRHHHSNHRQRPWRLQPVHLGVHRLPADPGGHHPGLWPPGRPLRPQARVLLRHRAFSWPAPSCAAWPGTCPPSSASASLQGCGAGAIQPVAATILGDIYTPAERGRIQGLVSSVFGVSAVIGPSLGAFLVAHTGWRAVFWVNVPIGIASIVMIAALPAGRGAASRAPDRLGRIAAAAARLRHA